MALPTVKAGESIKPRPLNDLVRIANQGILNLGSPFPPFRQSGIPSLGINKTGETLSVGECAAIVYDEATPYRDEPTKLEGEGTTIILRTPEEGDQGNFVIAGDVIEDDQAGLVYVSGVVLARLQQAAGSDEETTFADVDLEGGGNPTVLKMKSGGNAKVIDVITETNESGIDWALIKFPLGESSGTYDRPYLINRIETEEYFPIKEDDTDEYDLDLQQWAKDDEYLNEQTQYPGSNPEPTDGVRIAVCCRVIYQADGDQILHAYYRDMIFDSFGSLVEVSGEYKVIIDEPTDCT